MTDVINKDVSKDIDELINNVDNNTSIYNNIKDDKENNKDLNNKTNEEDSLTHKEDDLIDAPDETSLMLTTIDNPYNPKTDHDKWREWDHERGYFTEEYIARLITMEEDIDVEDEFTLNILTTKVINEILDNDDLNLYKLI